MEGAARGAGRSWGLMGVQPGWRAQSVNGAWEDGRISGLGTYEYVNGDRYSGSFRMGKREGVGTYVRARGETLSGTWRKDGLWSLD